MLSVIQVCPAFLSFSKTHAERTGIGQPAWVICSHNPWHLYSGWHVDGSNMVMVMVNIIINVCVWKCQCISHSVPCGWYTEINAMKCLCSPLGFVGLYLMRLALAELQDWMLSPLSQRLEPDEKTLPEEWCLFSCHCAIDKNKGEFYKWVWGDFLFNQYIFSIDG